MKYYKHTTEERIEIGRKIYESNITYRDAAKVYGISHETAHRYLLLYEEASGKQHKQFREMPISKEIANQGKIVQKDIVKIKLVSKNTTYSDYENMSKEELIQEIIKAKVNEARLKKGYQVKGVGAEKEFILLNNKNTK